MQTTPRNGTVNWLWVILLVVIANLVQLPVAFLSRGSGGARIGWAVVYVLGFVVAVAIAAWRYRKVWPHYQYRRLRGADWRLMIGAYVFIIVVEEVLNLLNFYVFHQTTTANNQAILDLVQRSPLTLVMMSLTAICASPFLEELTFRGLLMDGCLPEMGFWLPIVVSAVAFSLVHMSTTPASWLLYAMMGGSFAYVYRRTGKIQATIIMHAFNNLLAMGTLWLLLK